MRPPVRRHIRAPPASPGVMHQSGDLIMNGYRHPNADVSLFFIIIHRRESPMNEHAGGPATPACGACDGFLPTNDQRHDTPD